MVDGLSYCADMIFGQFEMLSKHEYGFCQVYLLCRSEPRATAAIDGLVKVIPTFLRYANTPSWIVLQDGCDGDRLIFIHCDLACKDSVRKCAADLNKRWCLNAIFSHSLTCEKKGKVVVSIFFQNITKNNCKFLAPELHTRTA